MSRVVKVDIKKLRKDGGTQMRVGGIDQERVDQYAADKKDNVKFPEPKAMFDGRYYWLFSGFHRTAADEQNGLTEIDVEVTNGSRRDAILAAAGENADHGLNRTWEDKRFAVNTLLQDREWRKFSDGVIAKKTGTSQPFASKLRREWEVTQKTLDKSTSSKRIGASGVVVDTAKIGKRAEAEPASKTSTARTDIDVDSLVDDSQPAEPAAFSLEAPDPKEWAEEPVVLHITISRGTGPRRKIKLAARHGDNTPLYLNDFTLRHLEPMPVAIAESITALKDQLAQRLSAAKSVATAKKKARKK